MMKLFSLLYFLLIFNSSFGQLTTFVSWTQQSEMPSRSVIYYTAGKDLGWENFKGNPQSDNSIVAALTVSGFGYNANISTTNGKGQLNINVYCYFSPDKSWVKPGKNTSYILTHEQRHFDISYLSAAIFIDKLRAAVITPGNFKTVLPRIYNETCDIMNKMQNDYDGQTKNGQVKEEQSRWNALIDSRIAAVTN